MNLRILHYTAFAAVLLSSSILSFAQDTCAFCCGGEKNKKERLCVERPTGLAMDGEGHLFIIQSLASIYILRLDLSNGTVSKYAGDGTGDYSGENIPATKAGLGSLIDIAFDNAENLLIADIGGTIRRIDAETKIITTIAGDGRLGDGGTGDGGAALQASFRRIDGLVVDSHGNIYVADDLDHRIRRIDAETGIITTFAGGGNGALGDGGSATKATLKFPSAIAIDKQDNLFIADYQHHRIRRVDAKTGIITTVAGTGDESVGAKVGTAEKVNMRYPRDIAIDQEGNIFANGGWGHAILRIDAKTKMVSIYAGTGKEGSSGDNGLATRAKINGPSGMVFDQSGNLYFADYGNNRIRRVDVKRKIISTVTWK